MGELNSDYFIHTLESSCSQICRFKMNGYTYKGSNTMFILPILSGWSGGAMVLGELPVPGRPTIWITVEQGPTVLAVGVGGGCLDIFTLIYPFFPLSPSLWKTARYRLKYCLKGPLNPKQPTNQPILSRGANCYRKQFKPLAANSSLKLKPLWKDTFSRESNSKLHKLFPLATLVKNIIVR